MASFAGRGFNSPHLHTARVFFQARKNTRFFCLNLYCFLN
jgi:hypothetical protein